MEFIILVLLAAAVFWLEGWLYRHFGARGLQYRCYLSASEVFEGDEIELVEELTNAKLLPMPWLKAEITASRFLEFAGTQSVVTDQTRFVSSFFSLRGYQKVVRRWKVKCLKFGTYSVERIVLVSSDLLGLESISHPAGLSASVRVLPRPAPLEELEQQYQKPLGELVVRRRFLPDPFFAAGVREYSEFDPMTHIHWNASAREGRLMVRDCESTAQQNISVILNMQSQAEERRIPVNIPAVENCIRICAACFDQTIATGIPLRFLTNGTVEDDENAVTITQERWGREHVMDLLRVLSGLRIVSTRKFPDFLWESAAALETTDIVLVSTYLDSEIAAFAQDRVMRGISVRLLILYPPDGEIVLPDCPVLYLYDTAFSERGEPHEQPEQPTRPAGDD